jgi:hypothetical protein
MTNVQWSMEVGGKALLKIQQKISVAESGTLVLGK